MARRSKQSDPEKIRKEVIELLTNFESRLANGNLREKVIVLVPIRDLLSDLGSSLIPRSLASSAIARILKYLQSYPSIIIDGSELAVVAGISEYARRVRQLRKEAGWSIATGVTIRDMRDAGESLPEDLMGSALKPDHYILLSLEPDRDAAHRWHTANRIRKKKGVSVQDKILEFLLANLGHPVTNEELRYVANDKTEWARRVRELRTQEGWLVTTKNTGRPDMPIGHYVLETDVQMEEHDRHIPDEVKSAVLERDHYSCVKCGWNYEKRIPADPKQRLELHHKQHHVAKGANDEANLITLCNVCHDKEHKKNG